MAPPSQHSRPADTRRASALPEDALYEILLRLAAKDLCRLRDVCRPWRSLLSDPNFIAAHAAFHPDPLFVIVSYGTGHCYDSDGDDHVLFGIMDLSGRVIKRQLWHADADERVMCTTELGLICVAIKGSRTRCQLINPATGAVHELPQELAAAHGVDILDYSASIVVGLVPSTGECKVLRVLEPVYDWDGQLYEVFTLDCGGNSQACWRAKQAPPYHCSVELGYRKSVVIDGVVYFLLSLDGWDHNPDLGLVASFDLETEEWSASIRGPLNSGADSADDVFGRCRMNSSDFSMAVLNGRVVLGYRQWHKTSSVASVFMDLWFLMDFEKGLWVKQHSIEISNLPGHHMVQPLLVLNDGRILLHHIGYHGLLMIFDPGSKNCTNVLKIDHRHDVCLYAGNIMSLTNRTS